MRARYTLAVLIPLIMTVSGCNGAKKDVEDYVQRAQASEAAGDIAKASSELKDALKISPLHAKANAMLAKIEDDQGDLQNAVNHYIVASRTDAGLLQPQIRLIELMIDANHLDEAQAKANATLGTFPNNVQALALRAEISQRRGDSIAAQADTSAVLAKDPTNARALAVLATSRLTAQDTQGATNAIDRGLAAHPGDVQLLEVRAAIFLSEGNPQKAVEALNAIVKAEPGNVAAHSVLASAEAEAGHYDQGLNHLKIAAAAEPNNVALQMALIAFLTQRGTPKDVIAQLGALIASNPTSSTYDRTLAEYYRQNGQIAQAEQTLEHAASRLGDSPAGREASVALAKAAILNSQFDAAKHRLDAVLASDPSNVDALMASAILADKNGRFSEAVADLLAVVKISPINAQAFQLLASDYLALGQTDLAVSAMQRAASVSPGDVDLQLRLAVMLQSANRIQDLNSLLTRLTLQAPTLPTPWLASGELAIQRKDFSAADRALKRLKTLPNAEVAVARLTGDLQAARGDAGAVASYEATIQGLSKPDPALLSAFIQAATRTGAAKDAAQFLETRAGAQVDHPADLWIAAMELWANANAMDKANAAFAKAVAAEPRDITPYEAYATLLANKNLFDQADNILKSAKGKVAEWSLLLLQGTLSERRNDLAAAMKDYKDAAALNPGSARAINNYASLLTDLSPRDKPALEDARSKLAGLETSTDPSIIDTIAWLDFRLGRLDEARQLLTQIKAGESQNPQLRFHMAAVLLAAGQRAEGLALLDTVKNLNFPGSDEAKSLSAT